MVDRIRQLLQARQLSPTQFADTIGVARPIVSHILGGRNKPSLEVVQKIIAAFPDVALPWLLSGQGDMLVNAPAPAAKPLAPPVAASEEALVTRPNRRSGRSADSGVKAPEAELRLTTAPAVPVTPPTSAEAAPEPTPAPSRPEPAPTGSLPPAIAPLLAASPKAIRRVLIFYSDGTFADFSPSQDAF